MPSICTFQLNRENATYFSGETIAGTVILQTTSEKNVRDVSIIFLGEGKVKWQESHTSRQGDRTTTNTTYFTSHETYIDNKTQVHGDGILPAGSYSYTFNIVLPWECPTSCEGKYGHIRYEISLKLNRYFRFDNVYKKPVTIIRTIDLNLDPALKLPLELEALTSACCWPCSKGKILYNLKIPFGAYAPGQSIRYALQISNRSMDDTEGYSITFCQKITFTAKSPYRKERHSKNILAARSFPDKCLRLTNRILEGELVIPATPTSSARSSIICVEYTLRVTVQLPCCRSDPELVVPIIIGTIPIRESLPKIQLPNAADELLPSAPDMALQENDIFDNTLPPNYNNIRPPSFEEATRSSSPFIDTDVDERNRIVGFRPLYPMYNIGHPKH